MLDLPGNSRISLRMLRYFQVLAEELHFGRAAARLNISQPPLSVQIKELEEAMNVALFERTSRTVALSPAGKVLKEEVDRLLSAAEQSLNYVRQVGRLENQHLNIGIIGSALWGALLPRLREFKERFPDIVWRLHEMPQHQQIAALRACTIDVAIHRNVIPHPESDIGCKLISREVVQVAVPEDHPLCQQRPTLKSLASYSFISLMFSRSDFASQLYERCVSAGFYPLVTHQVHEPQTALALVSAGMGIALLPESCSRIQWPGVRFLSLEEPVPADLYAFWYKGACSKTIQALISTINTA